MAGTIDGLNKAADSIAYSMVKQAPMNRRRSSLIDAVVRNVMFDDLVVLEKDFVNVRVDRPEIALEVGHESRDRWVGNREQRPTTSRMRFSSPGPK